MRRLSLMFCLFFYVACGEAQVSTNTPSDEQNQEVPNNTPPPTPQRPKTLIALGDSITAGRGVAFTNQAYPWLLQKDFDTDAAFVNIAVPGATSNDVRNDQLPELDDTLAFPVHGHVLVMMTVGGNDALMAFNNLTGPALKNATDNLRAIALYFSNRTKFPDGVSVFFTNVYDPSDGQDFAPGCFYNITRPGSSAGLQVWSDEYLKVANDTGMVLVDTLSAFKGHGFNYNNSQNPNYKTNDATLWFATDCIHPNERGHREMYKLFEAAIATRIPPA